MSRTPWYGWMQARRAHHVVEEHGGAVRDGRGEAVDAVRGAQARIQRQGAQLLARQAAPVERQVRRALPERLRAGVTNIYINRVFI